MAMTCHLFHFVWMFKRPGECRYPCAYIARGDKQASVFMRDGFWNAPRSTGDHRHAKRERFAVGHARRFVPTGWRGRQCGERGLQDKRVRLILA